MLSQTDLQEAQEKVAAWVAEGNIAFGEGRIEAALAIASSAIESHPSSTDALILKSLCLERLGNISEALVCAERVVELNPDSELDKIRRNGLRSALGNVLVIPDSRDRRAPLIAAIAATVMAACVCGAAVHYMSLKQPIATLTPEPVGQGAGLGTSAFGPQQSQPANSNPAVVTPPAATPPANDESEPAPRRSERPPFDPAPGSLPSPPVTGPLGFVPDDEQRQLYPTNGPQSPTPQTPTNDPAPTPDPAPGPVTDPTPQPPAPVTSNPPPDPGVISIKVHHGSGSGIPRGAQTVTDGSVLGSNGVEALSRTGVQQFMVGSYGAAATSFEKALHGGGDPIKLNQRLGQVYSQLGRPGDALAAYTRAIEACREALQSGKGNKANIQVILDACQSAAKVLGG